MNDMNIEDETMVAHVNFQYANANVNVNADVYARRPTTMTWTLRNKMMKLKTTSTKTEVLLLAYIKPIQMLIAFNKVEPSKNNSSI